MEPKIIRAGDLETKDLGDARVTDVLFEDSWPFSLAVVEKLSDVEHEGYDQESDVVYYVLEGQGKTVIDGTEYVLRKGDVFVSPKGTPYRNLSGLKLLAISAPQYDPSKHVTVD